MPKGSYVVADGAYFVPSWSDRHITYKFKAPPPPPGIGIPVLPQSTFVDVDSVNVDLTTGSSDDEETDISAE